MGAEDADTDELLRRAAAGDASAAGQLLDRHRDRLRRMVAVRMDPRVAGRVDASDVVQEAFIEASRKLPKYLEDRPLPFYPWLRQIAWEQLVQFHVRHVEVGKRTVKRERRHDLGLPDQSAMLLADRLIASGTSPSRQMVRKEMRQRVRQAIERLAPGHREVIVLRHLEQLQLKEVAAILGISEWAARSRYRRAVERLHQFLSFLSDDRAVGLP
jgi:RNA polymerase sigma-70 factor (ECF subfamily)